MMKKCSACGMAKDESCFASKNHYCRNCQAEMYKLGLKATEYRTYLTKQPKIENTATGSHRFGDDKQEFLSVLKNQLAGE